MKSRRRAPSTVSPFFLLKEMNGVKVPIAKNRAARKQVQASQRGGDGPTVREAQKNHRKRLLKKARRAVAKIQRESRRIARAQAA